MAEEPVAEEETTAEENAEKAWKVLEKIPQPLASEKWAVKRMFSLINEYYKDISYPHVAQLVLKHWGSLNEVGRLE